MQQVVSWVPKVPSRSFDTLRLVFPHLSYLLISEWTQSSLSGMLPLILALCPMDYREDETCSEMSSSARTASQIFLTQTPEAMIYCMCECTSL